jgi:hypothetical protein
MEEQQRNIDDVFRESLADYRETPPGVVWQRIAGRLDEEEHGRRRLGFYLRWPWIVLSLMLIVGGTWIVTGLNHRTENRTRQTANRIIEQPARPVMSPSQQAATENLNAIAPEQKTEAKQNQVPIINHHEAAKVPVTVAAIQTSPAAPITNTPESAHSSETPIAMEAAGTVKDIPAATDVSFSIDPPRKPDVVASLSSKKGGVVPVKSTGPRKLQSKKLDVDFSSSLPKKEASPESPAAAAGKTQQTLWTKPAEPPVAGLESVRRADIAAGTDKPSAPNILAANTSDLPPLFIPKDNEQPLKDNAPVKTTEEHAAVPQSTATPADNTSVKPEQHDAQTPGTTGTDGNTSNQPADPKAPDLVNAKQSLPLSLALQGGYEYSFNSPMQNRFNAAMKLLWQVNQTIAIGLQPALRFGSLPTMTMGQSGIYQRTAIKVDSFITVDHSPSVYNSIDTIHNYVVRETFDSIFVKGYTAGGSTWELELPVVIQGKLGKAWYVYGGPSVIFGGKLPYSNVSEPRIVSHTRQDSLAQSQALPAAAFNNYFGKSSLQSYSAYQAEAASQPASVRFGCLVGVGYSLDRFMAEASLHQQLSGYSDMPQSLRNIYASPSVRISVGYMLFSPKKK